MSVPRYRVPEAHRDAIQEVVGRMLRLRVIEESRSACSSPVILVPKPDGTFRFCNDFRRLNEVSEFDAYPMPRVDDLIHSRPRGACTSTPSFPSASMEPLPRSRG